MKNNQTCERKHGFSTEKVRKKPIRKKLKIDDFDGKVRRYVRIVSNTSNVYRLISDEVVLDKKKQFMSADRRGQNDVSNLKNPIE